jgi:hypothetical protein
VSEASGGGATPRLSLRLGLVTAVLWLAVAVPRLGDYGPTWDAPAGEYSHGEQYLGYLLTGAAAYLDFARARGDARPPYPRLAHRAPHPTWPQPLYLWYETHPFGGLLSAASCRLLWDTLGWMPALAAHHLPIVLWVAVLLCVLVRWAALRWGAVAGVAAALSLLLAPRFLADAFNNLKDAPEACLYALAILAFAAALARPRHWRFALAGALTGLALAQKFNALFIPPQVLLYWGLASAARKLRGRPAIPFPWLGALIAAAAGFIAWLAVSPMMWTDTLEGTRVFVDYWRKQGLMPFEVNRWDGLLSWLWATPPVLLALAALGACWPRLESDDRCLLLLGVALPIGRTALPGAINFDGVRHFLEFQPFLALLAAAGVAWLLELLARMRPARAPDGRPSAALAGALLVLLFAAPARAVVLTWPNGTCYFNAFVGGLGGAQARGIASATDYWAGSYWQGLAWLDEHAEPGASLLVPVASQVAAAAAPERLRPDLRLLPPLPPEDAPPAVLYVMYITRPSFYDAVAHELDEHDAPFHELKVQGGTILKIHRLAEPAAVRRVFELWGLRESTAAAAQRLYLWTMAQPPELMNRVMRVMKAVRSRGAAGEPEGWRELSTLLPEKLHADARLVLEHQVELAPSR